MNRTVIELALKTGIPPSVWVEEGEQAILTALELLEQADSKT